MSRRAWARPIPLAFVTGAAATVLITVLPFIRFAYRNPSLHIALETSEAVIAFFGAILVYGRFQQTQRTSDLVLVYVLGLLGGSNFFFAAIPSAFIGGRGDVFGTWAPLASRLVGAVLLVVAALGPGTPLARAHKSGSLITAAVVGSLLTVAMAVNLLAGWLPDLVADISFPDDATRPAIDVSPTLLAVQGLSFLLYSAAALGFARRAHAESDTFMEWLAAATWLNAFARANYLLFPSLYTDYVYTGDWLRLGFYLLLLVGIVRELRSYWEDRADAAVADERRRLARDLHDGLAQELVFINAQARRLTRRDPAPGELERLASAADRAVAESRRAIAALSKHEQTLTEALEELGEEFERATRIRVRTDLERADVPRIEREVLLRIAREALVNVRKFSGCSEASLRLRVGPPLELRIRDEGQGFDVREAEQGPGFGLQSMVEKARSIGGVVSIESEPGQGTTVTATLGDR